MCTCKNEITQRTPHCSYSCSCVDWSDFKIWPPHLRDNLIIERDVLTYNSLETLESNPAVLCVLGKCRKCSRQICVGSVLEDVHSFDTLMERLLLDVFCCDRNDETKIEDAAICLLHEADRGRAQDWITVSRKGGLV